MIISIPLSPKPAQTFSILLGDDELVLSLYWRQERVYMDIDVFGQALCRGAICEHDADIVQSPSTRLPGSFRMFDTLGFDLPRWDGLGERWVLMYSDEREADGYFLFG